MRSRSANAAAEVENSITNVRDSAGTGNTLKLMYAIAASVPKEPIISLAISRPATFFTTMPPLEISFPSSVTKVMPMIMSRAVP